MVSGDNEFEDVSAYPMFRMLINTKKPKLRLWMKTHQIGKKKEDTNASF